MKKKRFFVIASFEKNIININKYIYIFTFAILSFQKMPLAKNRAQGNVPYLENLSSQKSFFHTTPSKQLATRPSDFSIREKTRHRWRNNRVVEGSIWLRVKNPVSFIHRVETRCKGWKEQA